MIEGRSSSRAAHIRRDSGSAARQLSHLYLENERNYPKTPERSKNAHKTWQASVTNGLVGAGVYSAALGLTAYRIWRGDPRPPETDPSSPSEEEALPPAVAPEQPTQAEGSSPQVRVISLDHPPPAYEDLGHDKGGSAAQKDEEESLYEPDTPELRTPLQSQTSTLRHKSPHKHVVRYRKPSHRVRPSTHSHSSSSSFSQLDFSPGHSLRSTRHIQGNSIDEDDASLGPEEEEINRRLDLMAFRLQDLVIDGQAALASQVHVVDVRDDLRTSRRKHLKTAPAGSGLRERQLAGQRSSRSVDGSDGPR